MAGNAFSEVRSCQTHKVCKTTSGHLVDWNGRLGEVSLPQNVAVFAAESGRGFRAPTLECQRRLWRVPRPSGVGRGPGI